MSFQARRISSDCGFDYMPVSALLAGAVIVAGSLVAIANRPIAAGALGTLHIEGVWDVVKITGAVTLGAPIYWKTTADPVGGVAGTGAAQTSSTGATLMGYAVKAADAGDATVRVVLIPYLATIYTSLAAPIADPGNAGAIAVTNSGSVQIVTAGAETRTLAAPTFVGQQISLAMKTDGGDAVVTVATLINQAGNNTITFNDAGDVVVLVAIQNGANIRWRTLLNDGATLATV